MAIYYVAGIPYGQTDELYHFGRKGMKWGQNIFTKWAEAARKRGWTGLANASSSIAKGIGRANEYINADAARARLDRGPSSAGQVMYNRTLPGQLSNLYSNATTAYSEAAKSLGGLGKNIEQFYQEVMDRAYAKIEYGKELAAKFGTQSVKNIQKAGEASLQGGKKFLEQVMEKSEEAKEEEKNKKTTSSSSKSSSGSSSSSSSSSSKTSSGHGSVKTKDLETAGNDASSKDIDDFLEKYKHK